MGYRIKSRFIYKQVGQRLKQLRNQKGVSQKVVADYLGVDRSTYTNYEMGTTTMTYVTILMLARYFSVDFNTLLCYDLIPKRTIGDWETGKRTPPTYVEKLVIRELERIATENNK